MRLPSVPAALERAGERGPAWAEWLDRLPGLAAELLAEWGLVWVPETAGGGAWHGHASWVLAVRTETGESAVLKIGLPHEEAEHEHLALRHWGGPQGRGGAVRLLRADPRRAALLLERLPGGDLQELWDVEACEIAASLYTRLHVPAPPTLRPLTAYVERWVEALSSLPRDAPLPRRLVEQAVAVGRDLRTDPATDGLLVHGDLHYANVLRANVLAGDDEDWVVIDPKPLSGDPHYEVAPLLWNRWGEVVGATDARTAVRQRFHAVVDTAMLDEDRARDWVVLRMVVNAAEAGHPAQPAGPTDRTWLTTCITVAKAVQD
ncbi:aminoglycoside phosphotransferase family protein [Nocardioides massiliensis]|uniref:Streptomycin 6-kinase n=1 Tax=Nocardioides massiliensis TaxID=1325935 RepID=A0ABT9NPW6_9ACTN|nr:aminoglycoside phosphotransferase family protein [Nocardioides massiliensis]MDP9822408.1 streptomycin 6-kinase [Nocardioides massiliensis]